MRVGGWVRRRMGRAFGRGAPWRRFEAGVALLVLVLAFGTCGYMVVGLGVFDALYQTAITISTVGYSEVGPAHEVDRAYRAFTLILVLVGASTVVYTASVLLETMVQGTLDNGLRRRRVQRQIDKLSGHVIVAGWGRVGRAIADYARRYGLFVVVIDTDPDHASTGDLPIVVGDATDEDILLAAGIERASSLIAALGRGSDNLALTLTARSMRADLLIVARVGDSRDVRKFARAGASRVVNPYEIGGSRMAAIAFRPHVAEFLDEVIHADGHDVDIHELVVAPGSRADGALLAELTAADPGAAGTTTTTTPAAVIAIKGTDGRFTANPPPTRRLAGGDILIAVGSAAQIDQLATALNPN